MRTYRVWAVADDGRAFAVDERAGSRTAAEEQVLVRGLRVLDRQTGKASLSHGARGRRLRFGSVRYDEIFAEQLQVLSRSGIGPVESLRTLSTHAQNDYASALEGIRRRLEGGASLATAVEAEGGFDPLLIALLSAAERTSDLDSALERFIQHRERTNGLRQAIVTTALYPLLLMAVGTAVLFFLLFQVVPRFSGIFQSMHVELPWAASLMLQWGMLVRTHTWWLFTALGAIGALLVALASSAGLRQRAMAFAAHRGWLGRQLRLAALCRYYRTIASLLEGGIALPQSMAMAAELLPAHLRQAGAQSLDEVKRGTAPGRAWNNAGLSTAVAGQLIEAGQRTGQLGPMLQRAADFHEAELKQQVERFMRVLEPTVMTVVGCAIGVVVILMYMPIFELASAVR